MPNRILYAGGRLDSLEPISGNPFEGTNNGYFDANYCDANCSMDGGGGVEATFRDASFNPIDVVTGDTLWVHFEFRPEINPNGIDGPIMALHDSAGNPWLRVKTLGGLAVYGNTGTIAAPVWTMLGPLYGFDGSYLVTLDVKLTLGSPHSVEFYRQGSLIAQGTFTQPLLTALRAMRFFGNAGGGNRFCFSQMLATTGIPTIAAKVKTSRPNAAGSNSGWTGAFTNVNEASNSDASFDQSTTVGAVQSYAMGDITVPTGYSIRSVFHWMKAKTDGTSPANLKSILRLSGANVPSPSLLGMGAGFKAVGYRYDTNPTTSLPWTAAQWNAAEAGYQSDA